MPAFCTGFERHEQNDTYPPVEREYILSMATVTTRILTTAPDGDDGLIVTFSDGTTGAYVVEELLELRPVRERLKTRKTLKAAKGKAHELKGARLVLSSPSVRVPR
jgi:hypothetical protein